MDNNLKELVLNINEDTLCILNTLDISKVYLFQIEIGDMPIEVAKGLLNKIKTSCEEIGIKGIFIPTIQGVSSINVIELKKYLEINEEGE